MAGRKDGDGEEDSQTASQTDAPAAAAEHGQQQNKAKKKKKNKGGKQKGQHSGEIEKHDMEDHEKDKVNKEEEKSEEKEKLDEGDNRKINEEIGVEEVKEENKSSKEDKEKDEEEDEEVPELEELRGMLDDRQRGEVYEAGVRYVEAGRNAAALRCFLTCLRGLQKTENFRQLPQCLHKVADIYYAKEEFQKAIQFIQAEKMFYETALIDTSQLQKQLEKQKAEAEGVEVEEEKPDIMRADEYENLAKLCLEKKQPHLALEYQGKATKLRQQILGDSHPTTVKSLDLFAAVYGEVGKQQYSESMERFKDPSTLVTQEQPAATSPGNKSILKKQNSKDDKGERRVHFQDPDIKQQEEWISRSLLLILFFLVTVALSILFIYIYCKIEVNSRTCATWKSDVHYYYMRFKYFFYQTLGSSKKQYG